MEPERRIEKLLRAFAKKRRDQAGEPMELRPAARQRLQQEIARRTAKSSGGFFSNLFVVFRPRLAYALCAIAIVIAGGWFVFSDLNVQKNSTYAGLDSLSTASKKEPTETPPVLASAPTAAPSPATTPPPPAAPVIADAEGNRGSNPARTAAVRPNDSTANAPTIVENTESSKPVSVAENVFVATNAISGITVASAPSAPPPALKTEPVAADSFASASTVSKDVAASRALQPTAPPQAATAPRPAAPPALAKNSGGKFLEAQKASSSIAAARPEVYDFAMFKNSVDIPANTQRFNRADALADDKRALGLINTPGPVLTSFRVEQTGNQLRVVDADGSVYTGAMQAARDQSVAPGTLAVSPKNKQATTPVPKTSEAAQNYFFSVAGTNRNLNQNVVFSGNLIPFTNALTPASNAIGFGGALRTRRAAEVVPAPSLLSNSRISGKAVIGNEKEVEVNATPTP